VTENVVEFKVTIHLGKRESGEGDKQNINCKIIN